MRARIRHHQRRQIGRVQFGLGGKVGHVDIAVSVATGDDHAISRHRRTRRIGAVRRGGDQHDVAMRIPTGFVIGADCQQPGKLTLTARIGLQRDAGKPGRLGQPSRQIVDQRGVTLGLIGGCEGVDVGKARQGDRDHLRRGIQLHRAGAKRDHRTIEGNILVLQPLEIAQHLMLGVIGAEDMLLQEGGLAHQIGGDGGGGSLQRAEQQACQRFQSGAGDRFVECDGNAARPHAAQIEPRRQCRLHQRLCALAGVDADRVEEAVMPQSAAASAHQIRQHPRLQINAPGDPLQPLRPMPRGIESGDDSQQHLRGADIRRRFFAANMLLAGLQRQPHRRCPGGIDAHADQTARHRTLEGVAGGEERCMRPAKAHRHAETLSGADHHIRPHLTRRGEECQAEQIGGDDGNRAHGMSGVNLSAQIADFAGGAGILQHHGERRCGLERLDIPSGEFGQRVRLRPCAGGEHGAGLRMQVAGHRNRGRFRLRDAVRQRHRLSSGSGFVEQRGVGNRHGGQFADHRLEIHQRLQPPLRDFGLIRGIGGVPAGIFQHVAQDHRGRDGAVIALADQRFHPRILLSERAQFGNRRGFVNRRRQIERALAGDGGGHRAGGEIGKRSGLQRGQHRLLLGHRRADMAGDKAVSGFECREFGQSVHHASSTSLA